MVSLPALGLVLPVMVMYMYIQVVIAMFTYIINCYMYFPECPKYKHSKTLYSSEVYTMHVVKRTLLFGGYDNGHFAH